LREIRKSNTEKIVVTRTEYRGKERIDIRIHYFDVENGEWRPTKKGISFQPEFLEDIVNSLMEVAQSKTC